MDRDAPTGRESLSRHAQAGVQLVKGTREPGEDPLAGALRELSEEAGVAGRFVDLGLRNRVAAFTEPDVAGNRYRLASSPPGYPGGPCHPRWIARTSPAMMGDGKRKQRAPSRRNSCSVSRLLARCSIASFPPPYLGKGSHY
ncbi:MAG: NUDIX domain-containing protein [Devosia sp.]|nr:NUDIX domain-containing protein [Devosia sp.]